METTNQQYESLAGKPAVPDHEKRIRELEAQVKLKDQVIRHMEQREAHFLDKSFMVAVGLVMQKCHRKTITVRPGEIENFPINTVTMKQSKFGLTYRYTGENE